MSTSEENHSTLCVPVVPHEENKDLMPDFGIRHRKMRIAAPTATAEPTPQTLEQMPYIDMLERAYAQLAVLRPDFAVKKRGKLPPLQVEFLGSKKTIWNNFDAVCLLLHRTPEHIMSFLHAETGSTGNLDGAKCLVIKGKYRVKQIESLLLKYVAAYVVCPECQAPDTELTRDAVTRISFIECRSCTSKHAVQAITAGFKATNKADRKKARE